MLAPCSPAVYSPTPPRRARLGGRCDYLPCTGRAQSRYAKIACPSHEQQRREAPGHHTPKPRHPAPNGSAAPALRPRLPRPLLRGGPAPGPGSAGPLGSMRTRPPGPAPTRRGQPPAPHPRIADVHNGGGARCSPRGVNAQSAAAALRSDAGAAGPGLGLELGLGSRERRRKGRCAPGPATGRMCAPPDPPSRPLGQRAGRASAGAGPVCGPGWGGPMAGRAPARGGSVGGVGGSSEPAGRRPEEQVPSGPRGTPRLPRPHRRAHTGSGVGSALFRSLAGGDSGRKPGAGGRGQGKAAQQGSQHLLAHG